MTGMREAGSVSPSPEPPREDGARRHVARHVHERAQQLGRPGRARPGEPLQPRGEGREQPHQQEQQPPPAAAQRVEPQRAEQRHGARSGERPAHGPPRQGKLGSSGALGHAPPGPPRREKPRADQQPREQQPAERHRPPRRCGGTYPGPRRPRPGRAAVTLPWSSTFRPLTYTYTMPTEGRCGCSNVARSDTVAGSNTVTSANMPGARTPRSVSPTRWAGREVSLRTANSSGKSRSSRTYRPSSRAADP